MKSIQSKYLKTTKLILVGATCATFAACGPKDDKNNDKGEGASIDHATARQAITANTRNISLKASNSVAFIETSDVFGIAAERAIGGSADLTCTIDSSGTEVCVEEPTHEPVEFDTDIEAETKEMTDWLEANVFSDANVESENGTSVTYLIDGTSLCEFDEGVDAECVQYWEKAEVRLVVTSPVEGDIDVDILVGPNRDNPLSFEVHASSVALEVDLGGVKGALQHFDQNVEPIEFDLPQTFSGRVRGELSVEGSDRATASISVLSALKVADGDYSFTMGASSPAWSVTADATAETLESVTNLGSVDAAFPWVEYEYFYDETTDTETETKTEIPVSFHLDGATSTVLLDAANEIVKATGIGFGSGTSTFSMDGHEVLAFDLNDGGTFDATAKAGANDTLDIEISPSIDARVALAFAAVTDLVDVEEWMMDDVLNFTFDGAAKPKLNIGDEVKVVDGTLHAELEKAGRSVTVTAGQCLLEQYTENETWTPLDEFTAGTCE